MQIGLVDSIISGSNLSKTIARPDDGVPKLGKAKKGYPNIFSSRGPISAKHDASTAFTFDFTSPRGSMAR